MENTIYVGNLPLKTTIEDLQGTFNKYGTITEIRLKHHYAFIEFSKSKHVCRALKKTVDRYMFGNKMIIDRVKTHKSGIFCKKRTNNRVVVKNLSARATWRDLKYYMMKAGIVTFADVVSLHEGVVDFETCEDMERAIEQLNGTIFKGLMIHMYADSKFKSGNKSTKQN